MSTSALEIDSGDVIRLILQFLKENNLENSFEALQKETQIHLNTVINPEKLSSDIKQGHWDDVLVSVKLLKLPVHKLINLYEHIIFELAELREFDVCRILLKETQSMVVLGQTNHTRYSHIESILSRTFLDPKELYPRGKEQRRQEICDEIMREIIVVEPSRLLTLLGQSLKFMQFHGIMPTQAAGTNQYDIFRDRVPDLETEEESYPKTLAKTVTFSSKAAPESIVINPTGTMLICGSIDGFIEVYQPGSGELRLDLEYQEKDQFMMHNKAILCMNFSKNGEYLVSGSNDCDVAIWKLLTGECVREFKNIHTQGVSSVNLSRDDGQVLTTSFDGSVRIHGVKSGKTLKTLVGHTSYVNSAHWTRDNKHILSGSADGTIKVWDNFSGACLRTFSPTPNQDFPIQILLPLPYLGSHQYIVCNRSKNLFTMNIQGEVLATFSRSDSVPKLLEEKDEGDYVTAILSPKANFLYAATENGILHIYNLIECAHVHSLKIHDSTVVGLVHHPFRNILYSYDSNGILKYWRA